MSSTHPPSIFSKSATERIGRLSQACWDGNRMNRQNLGLVKLLWRNETVLSGLDATLLKAGLDKILDAVVEAMLETGRDMSERYKETAKAGLAICSVHC